MGWHPHPTEIEFIDDEKVLSITFSDDEEIDYDTRILRGYCPCAMCQGHGSRPLAWNEPKGDAAITVSDISQVGNYAMCIAWEDGHNHGIYSWEFLRNIVDKPDDIFEDWPPPSSDNEAD